MLRTLLLVSLAIVGVTYGVFATDATRPSRGQPLDLPSGGGGSGGQEEDAPETITFFGGEYEGDGFFWCLDKSCSMGWANDIDRMKAEVVASIQSLTESAEISLVAFSSGHIVWSPMPRSANTSNRLSAIAWVQALEAGGATCIGPATVETLSIANLSDAEDKQVIVLSDGEPSCDGGSSPSVILSTILAANWQQTPIHAVYIATDAGGISFMQQLAAQNGGTFSQPPG